MEKITYEDIAGWTDLKVKEQHCITLFMENGGKLDAYEEAFKKDRTKTKYETIAKQASAFFAREDIKVIVGLIEEKAKEKVLEKHNDKIEKANHDLTSAAGIKAMVLDRLITLFFFNINKFIKIDENGDPRYNFADATEDDFWCLDELGINYKEVAKTKVTEVKFKKPDKKGLAELILRHSDVAGLNDDNGIKVNINVIEKAVAKLDEKE